MLSGLYSAATAMESAARRHEIVAQNLAHADHPGYLRRMTVEGTFESAMGGARASQNSHESLGTAQVAELIDFTSGIMQQTGRRLDVALQGDGFFVIEGPDGPLYTRSGAFELSNDGQIVNVDGLPVSGGGGPITLPPDTSLEQLTITAEGRVIAGESEVGQLEVVSFDRPQALISAGVSLFKAPATLRPTESEAVVVQGVRERSNVSPVLEMVRMIDGMRQYEAAARALKTISRAVEQHVGPRAG